MRKSSGTGWSKRLSVLKRAVITVVFTFLVLVTVSRGGGAGNSGNGGTAWIGTYSAPDSFGGFHGTITFTVENNNAIFCIKFDQPGQARFDTPCQNPVTDSYPINNGQFSISYGTFEGRYILTGGFNTSAT